MITVAVFAPSLFFAVHPLRVGSVAWVTGHVRPASGEGRPIAVADDTSTTGRGLAPGAAPAGGAPAP